MDLELLADTCFCIITCSLRVVCLYLSSFLTKLHSIDIDILKTKNMQKVERYLSTVSKLSSPLATIPVNNTFYSNSSYALQ